MPRLTVNYTIEPLVCVWRGWCSYNQLTLSDRQVETEKQGESRSRYIALYDERWKILLEYDHIRNFINRLEPAHLAYQEKHIHTSRFNITVNPALVIGEAGILINFCDRSLPADLICGKVHRRAEASFNPSWWYCGPLSSCCLILELYICNYSYFFVKYRYISHFQKMMLILIRFFWLQKNQAATQVLNCESLKCRWRWFKVEGPRNKCHSFIPVSSRASVRLGQLYPWCRLFRF